jgi:putative ABC transport system permease protein
LPLSQYATNVAADNFHREVMDRLSSEPGVVTAGITTFLPSTNYYGRAAYTLEDDRAEDWKLKFTSFDTTYGDYFRAMKIPLIAGQYFTVDDRPDSVPVVIVNQSMAKHSCPGQQALGKRLHAGNPHKGLPWATVVGVVADTTLGSRDEPSDDQIYFPAQQPATLFGANPDDRLRGPDFGNIVLRSVLPPEQMSETLRAAVAKVDPRLALQETQPMSGVISNVETPRRFNTDLISSFAIGALLLAVTGIYAVMAFSVSLRTQEIAIRMALGSQRTGIARLVLGFGAKLALIGCAVGVVGSVAVSRLVTSFLFKVSPRDPLIYTAAVVLMMLMALLASTLPAIRAASADPIRALRST